MTASPTYKLFSNESIKLVITSPPYYQQRNYGSDGIGNETEVQSYLDNLLAVFEECVRITRPDGALVFNLGDKYQLGSLLLLPYQFAIQALARTPVKLINQIIWHKLNPTPRQDKRKLVQATEPFFIFIKGNGYEFNYDEFMTHLDVHPVKNKAKSEIGKRYFELLELSSLSSEQKQLAIQELTRVIQEVKTGQIASFRMKIKHLHAEPFGGQSGGRKTQLDKNGFTIIRIYDKALKKDVIETAVESIRGNPHPAVYPLFIIQQLILLLSQVDDVVLDPFCGSGTTCVAAKQLQRQFLGIELNPEYVDYAKQRLHDVNIGELELFI
ncbi:MAG: site-specific DNA-methyltransferase [Thiotrichaceae bacterium]